MDGGADVVVPVASSAIEILQVSRRAKRMKATRELKVLCILFFLQLLADFFDMCGNAFDEVLV